MAVMGVLAEQILCAGVTVNPQRSAGRYDWVPRQSRKDLICHTEAVPDRKDYINGSGKKKSKRNDAGKRKQAKTTYTNVRAGNVPP